MIFKKSSPDQMRGLITKFETELGKARQKLEEIDPKIVDTRIAIEEGAPGATESLAKLEAQRTKVAAEAVILEKTLHKVKEKLADAIAEEQRAAIEARWDECEAMVKDRTDLAEQIVAETESLVKKLDRFKETGRKLYELAPAKDQQLNLSHLSSTVIDNHFRFLLLSLGVQWATYWGWGDATIPKFMDHANESHGWILKGASQELKPVNSESAKALKISRQPEFVPSQRRNAAENPPPAN